ncbi:MAG: M1 family metallopeptidase [Acidobacteriaceae bacterium]
MSNFSKKKWRGKVYLPACTCLTILALLLLPAMLHAQRLPQNVHPAHYTLTLAPDLKAATFTGKETIDVVLSQPAASITLNAAEITFKSVTITENGTTQKADVSLDKAKEQATFTVPHTIPAGKATIAIQYDGILNNELRGFYLSKTPKRNYAVTQFEPTDARRAFPSFDEPEMKATYSVTLIVDKGDTAISNTNIISDTPGPVAGKHTLKFATTPKLSTYLVAFLVGDFQCLSGESDGVPIRACATPDKVQYGKFALAAAEFNLHYYDQYFGIKYPMPKLDMIALPDFEAGAMENFGAITYRETAMLLDEKTATVAAEKNVAIDVAHEMAHQWFGDMVTMKWWNNIWLNEGFATWMENKPVAAWKPEWHMEQDEANSLDGTLNLDSLATTRTIRATADTPSQINEMFDGISYGKAGAVLAMVENYLGKETFRRGVHNYLAAHMYGNATAEDFWNAQTATSKQPVDKIMSSFVVQPGVPLLTFTPEGKNAVSVAQRRFFLSPTVKLSTDQSWTVPVCFDAGAGKSKCEVLTPSSHSLTLPASAPFLYANAGARGYYRSEYSKAAYKQIVAHAETALLPQERISLLGDQWALMRSGNGTVGDFLDLVEALHTDKNAAVLENAFAKIGAIDERIATPEERTEFADWIRTEFGPAYHALPAASASDSPNLRELRGAMFANLGYAKDPAVIAEAHTLAEKYLADQTSVEPSLARSAIAIASKNGDAAFYDQLLKVSETTSNPELRTTALFSLAEFTNPALVTRTLDYVADGHVRNQDSWILLVILMRTRDTREQAWQYIQQHWDKIKAQLTVASGARIVSASGSFCSAQKRTEVLNFFGTHKLEATDRTLKIAADSISDCAQLRAAQEPNLKQWLETKK